ncbi:MAG: hypothetical protein O7G84_01260 [Gammaproteobacteria bacterium]|nr:hypothetical protein [Gammaproteobacteria bacterium]
MPTERPILFNGAMVRALLDGTKTQTRRIVKAPKGFTVGTMTSGGVVEMISVKPDGNPWDVIRCPYGVPGDRLWVRETFRYERCPAGAAVRYRADNHLRELGEPVRRDTVPNGRWRPSIHMFRCDSRITLEVTDVRVERVQDITWEDVEAEGTEGADSAAFADLWDSINAKRGYGWEANPWVWVVEFNAIDLVG